MTDNNIEEYREKLKSYRRAVGRKKLARRMKNPLKWFPWSTVILLVALSISLKSFVILRVGESQVEQRLAGFDQSAISNQIGVFVMKPGPVSRQLSAWAQPLIGGRTR